MWKAHRVRIDRYRSVTCGLKGLDHLNHLARRMYILFAPGEGNVDDGRMDTWQKNETAARPVVPTLGLFRDGGPTSMIARNLVACSGRTRVLLGEEPVSIKEPIILS